MIDLESLVKRWDGEEVIIRFDRPSGAWIFIAIHSTRLGPAVGGTRLRNYASLSDALEDALRLAEAMTYKFAVAEFPRGGGKAVIAAPPGLDDSSRRDLVHRYGQMLGQLGELFTTGPDVGTSSEDMNIIADAAPGRAFSRTVDHGGKGSSAPPTALGVLSAIEAASDVVLNRSTLRGVSVVVQGAGNVGGALIEHLRAKEAVVRFTDVDPKTIAEWTGRGVPFLSGDDVYAADCDVFAPCALSGTLNRQSIPKLRCRIVAGAANSQLSEEEDAERLRNRDIAYVPDFVANAGGAMAITGMEALGWSDAEAERRVRSLGNVVREVLAIAAREAITTQAAALRLARNTLSSVRIASLRASSGC